MGRRKLDFTSLFSRMRDTTRHTSSSLSSSSSPPPPWPWPSCKHPKTRSFREEDDGEEYRRTGTITKASYFDLTESCLSNSSSAECESFSTESDGGTIVEAVIRGLRSERLFFEPGTTSSMVEQAAEYADGGVPFEGSIAMAVDSDDPYRDFKQSMEEMLMAHGVKDWAWLEEMLGWYLRANGEKTHGFIVGAFVDLLLGLACSSPPPPPSSSSSSSTFEIEEAEEEEESM